MRARVLIPVVSLDDMRTPFEEYPDSVLIFECICEAAIDAKATIAERFNHDSLAGCPTDPPSRRFLRFRRVGETSRRAGSAGVGQSPPPPGARYLRCGRAGPRLRCRESVCRYR